MNEIFSDMIKKIENIFGDDIPAEILFRVELLIAINSQRTLNITKIISKIYILYLTTNIL